MATTARGIVYPVVGTTLTPLANHFAALATSTNTAIDNAVAGGGAFRGLTSAMGAAGQEGRTYYATDTNRSWFDDGTNWVSNDNGMYLIRPTSVVGGTISADGTIVPTSSGASVSFNGVFSSRYKVYKVYYFFRTTAATSGYFRFRRAGTDIVLGYGNQRMYAAGGAPGGSQVIGTFFDMGASSALFHSGDITLMNMTESTDNNPKTWLGSDAKGVPTAFCSYGGFNGDSTAVAPLDGFSIFAGASTYSSLANNYFKVYGCV